MNYKCNRFYVHPIVQPVIGYFYWNFNLLLPFLQIRRVKIRDKTLPGIN